MRSKLDPLTRLNARWILRAWVSQKGARHQPEVGTRTYHDIYLNAPAGVRYAVVEKDEQFFVFDLWEAREVSSQKFIPEENVDVYRDLDHAIGSTMMKYGNTGLLSRWMTPRFVVFWKEWRDK